MNASELGPYRLRELLGRGGMGEVWRALDTRKDREVALKVLGDWLGGDEGFAARFRREAARAARLRAPNIVPIHDYGEIDGRLFIDMPLVEGTDLAHLLDDGPLPPERAVAVVEQIARALATAHAAGLVHRDVKPSNVLVTASGHVYLIDFGICRDVDGSRTSLTGAALGTPAYMAPEQFDGGGDLRADVYALGCVLVASLTGAPPFPGPPPAQLEAHLQAPPPRPSSRVSAVPAALDGVVARAMAKNPAARYGSAPELARAAREAVSGTPPTEVLAPGPLRRRHRWFALTGALAGVVALAVTAFVVTGQDEDTRPQSRPRPISFPVERTIDVPDPGAVSAVGVATVDGRTLLLSGGSDGRVRTWDPSTGAPVGRPGEDHRAPITDLVTTDLNGTPVVVSGDESGEVYRRDLSEAVAGDYAFGDSISFGNRKPIAALSTTRLDGRTLLLSVSGYVSVLDLATGYSALPVDDVSVGSVTSGGDATAVTVIDRGGAPVMVYGSRGELDGDDLRTRQPVYQLPATDATPRDLATTVLDRRPVLVAGNEDGTLEAWYTDGRLGTDPVGQPVPAHRGPITSVATSTLDGRPVVVTAGEDGDIRIWDLATRTALGPPMSDHFGPVRSLATTTLGGRPVIVSGAGDGMLRIWDLAARAAL